MPTSSTGKPAAPRLRLAECGHLRAPDQGVEPCPACSDCWPASTRFFASLGAYARHREQELQ